MNLKIIFKKAVRNRWFSPAASAAAGAIVIALALAAKGVL